jgi:hypothetical protein
VDAALALLDKTSLMPTNTAVLSLLWKNSMDSFLAKWQKLNIKLGRDQDSRPAIQDVLNKMPAPDFS